MDKIDPKRTALVAIDMHRGHLDPAIATLPLPAERCSPVIARAARLFDALRARRVPIVHVVTEYRDAQEILANPFWRAIHDDPAKARKRMSGHNIIGERTTEIMPDLLRPGDWIVRGKKRYNPFRDTDLAFLLDRRLQADTLILAGINTTSCVLCCAFEATNRDYRVVVASDAVDSMDGEDMHGFALRLMAATVGWVLGSEAILAALEARP
jgi:nicotinamidase-related amidase